MSCIYWRLALSIIENAQTIDNVISHYATVSLVPLCIRDTNFIHSQSSVLTCQAGRSICTPSNSADYLAHLPSSRHFGQSQTNSPQSCLASSSINPAVVLATTTASVVHATSSREVPAQSMSVSELQVSNTDPIWSSVADHRALLKSIIITTTTMTTT